MLKVNSRLILINSLQTLISKMHVLQPKHTKLKEEEVKKLSDDLNISLTQLPKIKINDSALPEDSKIGEVFKIERKIEDGKTAIYYRVVSI